MLFGLALLLAAVVALAVVFNPSGTKTELPQQVESVFPAPDSSVQRQARLVVDMAPSYSLTLRIDGVSIPVTEVRFFLPGRYSWEPGPGRSFERWTPGLHQAEISWDRIAGLPDVGGYTWSFRVQ